MTIKQLAERKSAFAGILGEFDDSIISVDATEVEHFYKVCKHFYKGNSILLIESKPSGRFEEIYSLLDEYSSMYGMDKLPDRKLLETMEGEIGTTPLFMLTEDYILDAFTEDPSKGFEFLEHLEAALEMQDIRILSTFMANFYGLEETTEKIEKAPIPFPVEKANTDKDWFDVLVESAK